MRHSGSIRDIQTDSPVTIWCWQEPDPGRTSFTCEGWRKKLELGQLKAELFGAFASWFNFLGIERVESLRKLVDFSVNVGNDLWAQIKKR